MARWSHDELIILIAAYHRYGLKELNRGKPVCRALANSFGRSESAIERQARNLDDFVRRKGIQHGGRLLTQLWKRYRRHLPELYRKANEVIKRNHWNLKKF